MVIELIVKRPMHRIDRITESNNYLPITNNCEE